MVISVIDYLTLADGVYIGRQEAGRWTNEVSVTTKNGIIEDIQLVKGCDDLNELFRSDIHPNY